VANVIDSFTTTMCNLKVTTLEHTKKMKNKATGVNIGLFDNAIEKADLAHEIGIKAVKIMSQIGYFVFPGGHGILVLAFRCPLKLGGTTGHPSFARTCSSTYQVSEQPDLLANLRENSTRWTWNETWTMHSSLFVCILVESRCVFGCLSSAMSQPFH
jgi:S-adenosylhomocysteine hydrolase